MPNIVPGPLDLECPHCGFVGATRPYAMNQEIHECMKCAGTWFSEVPPPRPQVCQFCAHYAQVRRRTVNQGWHVAEWGECRKTDQTKTGSMTPENHTCSDYAPKP